MRFKHEPKAPFQVFKMLNTNGSSHQTRHAVAPFVIQAFNETGLATAFSARSVLPRSKQLGIGFVEVGIDELTAIARRQAEPEAPQTSK